mmetsp:Transcript_28492/g.73178  ORF Transcript_28492/g.73178 Transcript_28492/m.73178 type:complete len:209 (-) Transcript_28492:585-1211(-)
MAAPHAARTQAAARTVCASEVAPAPASSPPAAVGAAATMGATREASAPLPAKDTAGQARAAAGASRRARRGSSRASTLRSTPAISRLVMNAPVYTRATSCPAARRAAAAARATMCVSSTEVPPRLFTISATRGGGASTARMRPTSCPTSSSAGHSACLARPGSPWMPSPTSTLSPASRSASRRPPGTTQEEIATPMEPTAAAAAAAFA